MANQRLPAPTSRLRLIVQWTGLVAGPLVAGICYLLLPDAYRSAADEIVQFSQPGRATMAMLVWMALWWLTESVPIYVTALLPLSLFPLLNVASMRDAASPYANPLIFLFMGGFLLALSMERWGLGKRIALTVLRAVGSNPIRIVAGFMFTTAILSAFVSNTATTAMMLPIALSVTGLVHATGKERAAADANGTNLQATENLSTCLMLGIAYAGSIGGIATIIGTPPNVFLVGFLQDGIAKPYQQQISFLSWLVVGVPLAVIFLPIVLYLLTRVLYPIRISTLPGVTQLIEHEFQSLGRVKRGEWATFAVFIATAACWIFRPLLSDIEFHSNGAPGNHWPV